MPTLQHHEQRDATPTRDALIPSSQLTEALQRLEPPISEIPLLASLVADTDHNLVAVPECDIDPDAWEALRPVGTLSWLAAGMARNPWTVPPTGYLLLTPAGARGPHAWAADRCGGIYEITHAPPRGLRAAHYLTAGPARRATPLPRVPRALAALALAACGHHPLVPHAPVPALLLLGGDDDLFADLQNSQSFYRVEHFTRSTPPLDAWADAPLVLITPDQADRCRDLPLRPGVLLLAEPGADVIRRSTLERLGATGVAHRDGDRWHIRWLPGQDCARPTPERFQRP